MGVKGGSDGVVLLILLCLGPSLFREILGALPYALARALALLDLGGLFVLRARALPSASCRCSFLSQPSFHCHSLWFCVICFSSDDDIYLDLIIFFVLSTCYPEFSIYYG